MPKAVSAPCRYRLGSSGSAKALTLFREGWAALPTFQPLDRAAIVIVGASLIPYSPPHREHVRAPSADPIPILEWRGKLHTGVVSY